MPKQAASDRTGWARSYRICETIDRIAAGTPCVILEIDDAGLQCARGVKPAADFAEFVDIAGNTACERLPVSIFEASDAGSDRSKIRFEAAACDN